MSLGRLTLNPLKHIDPFMTIVMPIALFVGSGGKVIFGGAKPVPVNPRNYRNYRRGDVIVSAAGIATNLVLVVVAILSTIVLGLVSDALGVTGILAPVQRMIAWGIWLNLLLAFFNLIPIPPLDGSHLLYHALPSRLGLWYRQVGRFGIGVLLVVVFVAPGALFTLLTPAFALQAAACAAVSPYALTSIPVCQ
jgi:Zn-dependent protease